MERLIWHYLPINSFNALDESARPISVDSYRRNERSSILSFLWFTIDGALAQLLSVSGSPGSLWLQPESPSQKKRKYPLAPPTGFSGFGVSFIQSVVGWERERERKRERKLVKVY